MKELLSIKKWNRPFNRTALFIKRHPGKYGTTPQWLAGIKALLLINEDILQTLTEDGYLKKITPFGWFVFILSLGVLVYTNIDDNARKQGFERSQTKVDQRLNKVQSDY